MRGFNPGASPVMTGIGSKQPRLKREPSGLSLV
jgi:hypothetical protein